MPIEKIVADANVLLSAVTGKAALRIFTEYKITVHATQFNKTEVEEYLPVMANKYGISHELLQMQWKLLPIQFYPFESYQSHFDKALTVLAQRDPEDAHALALANHLHLPLWSNDRDLHGLSIDCYTTANLLAHLSQEQKPTS